MKHLIILTLLISSLNCYSQRINNLKTLYSKTETGQLGSEIFTFTLNNSEIKIVDNYYNTTFIYGPLYLAESGYNDEGLFVESYRPDIKSDPLAFARGKEVIAYNFIYDTKGGNILFVDEAKIINKNVNIKIFYTQEGYNKTKK